MHLLDSKLNLQEIENILNKAYQFSELPTTIQIEKPLRNKILATLFYEPSTRTRLSFETAMYKLGGNVISVENGKNSSSDKKGESLRDTILTVAQYADIIALRYPNSFIEIAEECPVPIINAGDGAGEHPTQALLDLYTIKRHKGKIDDLNIMISGDLLYSRTAHSLISLLKNYKCKIFLHEPESLPLPQEYLAENMEIVTNRKRYLPEMDILYVTRPQTERWMGINYWKHERDLHDWTVNQETIELLNPTAGVMHALPRNSELPEYFDKDPRCLIWKQVKNGVFVRMAILLTCLKSNFKIPEIVL